LCCFRVLGKTGQRILGAVSPMRRSDDYRRFAAECLKIGQAAEDEQQRALFLQMARTWLALAQKDETNPDCAPNLKEEIN
jgi:hypothetical protein